MFEGITINGVPLAAVVDGEDRKEKLDFRAAEIQIMGKAIKAHPKSNSIRNHSGAKTGRGRLIFSAAQGGWLA